MKNAKTSPEDSAKIAESVEKPGAARLEMNENGEITITKPEPSMFAKLPNPCVYCGPSVRGVARQYTTYQGGIPEVLQTFLLEHPEALDLVVSTLQFPAMLKRLETPGTEEAAVYRKIKEELRTGRDGRTV